MPREDAIRAEGVVTDVLPERVFRVELLNGHRIVARAASRLRLAFVRLGCGDRVVVEMSPYDLSKGVIVLTEN